MSVINVSHLTKDYGHGRGVFDITFHVDEGEVFGFLGPNGAGKTTTIRHIMGFSKPQTGTTAIQGRDSWQHYDQNQRQIGYLPGEIALPEALTGRQFIKMMAELRGIKDMRYTDSLIERFELDPSGGLKRMSLGMKRKLAIVTAFMHDPTILILDEPTSGTTNSKRSKSNSTPRKTLRPVPRPSRPRPSSRKSPSSTIAISSNFRWQIPTSTPCLCFWPITN
ncbi:ABC transporter ATP-binding protein [Lacticaseibacillus daqingensis]|uniref:ABC transporter ATP-binding protein n=1 Tax=Lacticaseibacillus daqingensis TaxID=2486014 RepID=UPI000F7A7C2C|nr:ABC transporter ATP-binding protein [Lacticaseibacillus daqingensis]